MAQGLRRGGSARRLRGREWRVRRRSVGCFLESERTKAQPDGNAPPVAVNLSDWRHHPSKGIPTLVNNRRQVPFPAFAGASLTQVGEASPEEILRQDHVLQEFRSKW